MALLELLGDRAEALHQVAAQPHQAVVGADAPEQQHRCTGPDHDLGVAHRSALYLPKCFDPGRSIGGGPAPKIPDIATSKIVMLDTSHLWAGIAAGFVLGGFVKG